MPYELYRQEKKWCVRNSATGDSKGCSESRTEAVRHMRLLYHVESGGKLTKEIDDMLKQLENMTETEADTILALQNPAPPDLSKIDKTKQADGEDAQKHYHDESSYMPRYYGATSFKDLDAIMVAEEKTAQITDLVHKFPMLAMNAINSPEVGDKGKAIQGLATELAQRVAAETRKELQERDSDIQVILQYLGVTLTEDMSDEEIKEEIEKAISRRSDVSEADRERAVGKYGDVTYADEKNKKYPIDTADHIRAAWNYINKPKNAAKYSSSEVASIKSRIVSAWKKKIDKDGPPSASKESGFLERVSAIIKSIFPSNEPVIGQNFLVWKEQDRWLWLARYSNNFRDRDKPPEIISEKSHRRFVERVEKGLAPYPELWLWHVPQWKIGQATWVGYDDSGFALAAGFFDKGCEQVAEWLNHKKDVLVSHGMPPTSIKRDPDDNSIITEHESREISPLPEWAAANELTGFLAYAQELKEEADMAIPKQQKAALIAEWGFPETLIDQVEALNKTTEQKAVEEGLERKEKKEEPETVAAQTAPTTSPAPDTSATADAQDADPEKGSGDWRKEVAEAVSNVIIPYLTDLEERVKSVEGFITLVQKEVEKVKSDDETKIANLLQTTPTSSLGAILAKNLRAVGNEKAQADGSLSQTKPQETPVPAATPPTGIEFINRIVAPQPK